MQDSYEKNHYWQKYQPFFPEEFRSPMPNKPPQEEWWKWNGYNVHVDRVDTANAPCRVILVHGAGGYGRFLAPIGCMLSRAGYSYVAPDLPGYGLTFPRKRDLKYADWVQMLSDFIDRELARDPTPVVLFGLSLGGMLAYQASARNDKVSGLIATTLMDCRDPKVMRRISKYEKLSDISQKFVKRLAFLLDGLMIPVASVSKMDCMSHNDDFTRIVIKDKIGGDNMVPVGFFRTLGETGADKEPEEFDLPVLLAHPAADTWTPYALSEPFFNRLRGKKQLVLLENCGHAPIELPGAQQLHDSVMSFLKSLEFKKISEV